MTARQPQPSLNFSLAERHLGDLHASSAASLLAASGDLVLLLAANGDILDLACSREDLASWNLSDWIGQPWERTVTGESVPKIQAMLQDAQRGQPAQSRQVNHPSPMGSDLPVAYRVVPLGDREHAAQFAAIGRDLRDTTRMQQRLVAAQTQMERDHWQAQAIQTRAQAMIELSGEALLVLEADQWSLVQANTAARQLLGPTLEQSGWTLLGQLGPAARQTLMQHAAQLQSGAGPRVAHFNLDHHGNVWQAALQRADVGASSQWLLRLSGHPTAAGETDQTWAPMATSAPDALLITNPLGIIEHANPSFLRAVQCTSPEQVLGTSLETWLGRQEVDQSVLLSNLKQHGSVRLFATELHGALGTSTEVEISAAAIGENRPARYGFVLRDVSRRLDETPKELPRTASEMTELVGRLPLKDIVRETTDLIEQLCIQAALELTGDNRASAAEMLGLSRQSLYIKLRRFQLGDSVDDTTVKTESQT
jgi:transcriptional regulator PpsR